MGDVDANTLAASARRYNALRTRLWWFLAGFWGWFVLLVVIGSAVAQISFALGQKPNPVLRAILSLLLVLGFLTWWGGSLVTSISLNRFRCPRCGKRFILTWWSSWPTNHCKHCDLDLGPATMVLAKKPPVEAEL